MKDARRRRPPALPLLLAAVLVLVLALAGQAAAQTELSPLEELGKALFFDENLSTPPGQSCATCHAPEAGWTGPDSDINETSVVYPGAVFKRFGNRKPPTAAYGGDSPELYYNAGDEVWVGGMFWDGRATGWTLHDPLAEQAQGPFLNPLEQNNPNAMTVCLKVALSDYADLYEAVWGGPVDFLFDVGMTYENIARSISAYERSAEVNPFNSKFDEFWDALKNDINSPDPTAITVDNWEDYTGYGLSDDEVYGFAVFNDEEKGKCALCHTLDEGTAGYPLFTDFTYDNLGVPKNPDNPFYDMSRKWNPAGAEWIDTGLGGFLQSTGDYDEEAYMAEWGKQKVPTLRNVDLRPNGDADFVKAYAHNGYFKSLAEIVNFYNTRDVANADWPAAEVPDTVNTEELGNLGLTATEEAAIVTFMTALSDQ